MDSFSRRRKLSNANSFSGKKAYDGVFSGHRPKYDGAPAVKVDEYLEIFSCGQVDSSIPVLDLSTLADSSDDLDSEIWSTKPDYGKIFGGFRDLDIAISYQELIARDKARGCAPSSASQRAQDLGDLSNQPLDALKQFNMAYNKISQRSKDGLAGKTHVTQLHAVPGFTCFMNESASQPKESFVTNNVHPGVKSTSKREFPEKQTSERTVEFRSGDQDEYLSGDGVFKMIEVDLKPHPSKVSSLPAASQPNKETKTQKSYITNNTHPSANSSNEDFREKQTSQTAFREQDESLFGDRIFKTIEVDLKQHPSKVSSPPAASQPNKESGNQKLYVTNNIHPGVNSSKGDFHVKQTSQSAVESRSRDQDESLSSDGIFKTFEVDFKPHPSKVSSPPAASQSNKETENQKSYITSNIHPIVNSSKGDFHEKQTLQSAVESRSRDQDESLSGDRIFKTFEVDPEPHPSKVSSPPAVSKPNKETENQKSCMTNNIHPSVNSSKGDFHEEQTSQSAVESRSRYCQDESIYDGRNFKTFQANLRSHPTKVSPSPVPSSATCYDNCKDYQKRSMATNEESPPTWFDEELDVNSAAAVSAAALRKAIEKAQENIRIAKESMGRKKGLGGFSSKSFKDSLKIKAKVGNVKAGDGYKEKDDKIKEKDHKLETAGVFPDFIDGEKLFGAKKVIHEVHGKIPELGKNSEIPIRSPFELREDKILCNPKSLVNKTESRPIENIICEGPQKDVGRPDCFLVVESCEKKLGDTESNNFNVHQKVEDDQGIPRRSDENGILEKFSEESIGFFEINMQENLEQEHDEKVGSAVSQVEDQREVKDEEMFYNVCEVGSIKNAETYNSIETNDLFQKEDYEIKEKENDKAEETWKKLDKIQVPETYEQSSIDFDGAEESKSVIDASQVVNDDAEDAHKVGRNDSNVESSQEIGDVSRSSSSDHEFRVEETEAIEKEKIENISSNEAEDNNDECDAKTDDLANCDLADMDFIQNHYSVGTNHLSQKEDYEIKQQDLHKAEETWKKLDRIQVPGPYENSSSDCNDVKEIESVIGASQIVDDTEDVCKVGQNNNNTESSQEVDDVSSGSSSGHDFQVEDIEALEKEMLENISSDETEDNEDTCDAKSDDLVNCGLADMGFVQNDVRSESFSDTILGMEIEVKEQKEREDTVEKEDNNLQQSHEETPEIRIRMETETQQEPDDASRESEPSKMVEEMHNEEEREQERIKLAVERAIREARERAFAEVRQRVIVDTQEKVTKASSDKTCAQAKLKAERAAVERATAEARQRALEKAISQKKISEPKIQVKETNQTTSTINHTNAAESALRSKAILEKHNRIMERAAKALAEKEKRDLLALKEQAERSRLAENLDADIKRWSSGKEGNLRALLSTLQYILGADSGWQPVSLTEIITTSAVKKAYRKATLCVHPDKLQQRGASIQQKYICEKVFDLLKAAWNRFNSEER